MHSLLYCMRRFTIGHYIIYYVFEIASQCCLQYLQGGYLACLWLSSVAKCIRQSRHDTRQATCHHDTVTAWVMYSRTDTLLTIHSRILLLSIYDTVMCFAFNYSTLTVATGGDSLRSYVYFLLLLLSLGG